jgi:hypothetical protein
MDDAVCAQTDPDAFFPDKGGSVREAKRICASCEVKAQCLAYALERQERFGIWGGMSERQRRGLQRINEQRAAAGRASGAVRRSRAVARREGVL